MNTHTRKSSKKQLILLSDLWGIGEWTTVYIQELAVDFEVKVIDVRKLAQIDPDLTKQKDIHGQFVEGGIDIAVENLINMKLKIDILIGLSIGGTIGWKALLNGLTASKFYGISATRLRLETQKPNIPIQLLYGTEDSFKPDINWFSDMNIQPEYILDAKHEFYRERKFITDFAKRLRRETTNE